MKTNYLAIFIACMSIFTVLVHAENMTETSKNEIQIMHYNFGAKVRMLQLEKSVSINILRAENVIAEMKARNITNTTGLEAITEEMKLIKGEIKNISYSQNASALARQFVDIKRDAIGLSKNFRDTLRSILLPEQIAEIRQSLNATDTRADIKQINEETRKALCEYRVERVKSILNKSEGVAINKTKNCEMGNEELKNMVRKELRIEWKDRNSALERVRAIIARRNEFRDAASQKFMENYQERIIQRLEERSGKTGNQLAREQMQERINTARRSGK